MAKRRALVGVTIALLASPPAAAEDIRGGMMTMGRQKTGVPFNVEIMPRLQAAID